MPLGLLHTTAFNWLYDISLFAEQKKPMGKH